MQILVATAFFGASAQADEFTWGYDFEGGVLTDDWEFNTNNSAVVSYDYYAPTGQTLGEIQQSSSSVYRATAIHEESFDLAVGDKLTANLAWSGGFAQNQPNAGNNEILQFGVINLKNPFGASTETFTAGDGFWLSARETSATAPTMIDEWGTVTFDFYIHTDNTSTPATGLLLGKQSVNTFKQDSVGNLSFNFLDINLELKPQSGGVFSYGIGVDEWVYTFGASPPTWVDQGDLVDYSGILSHNLNDLTGLRPAIGQLVSDSSSQGVTSTLWATGATPVPEPTGGVLAMLGLALLFSRRSR